MAETANSRMISGIMEKYPPLSFDEERAMIDEYLKKNDIDGLKEKLILHNVGIINIVAKGWKNIYDENDFYSFGMEGLMLAADKFDHKMNVKFSAFCGFPIKTAMRNHAREYINKISVNSTSIDTPISDDEGASATFENFVDGQIKEEYKRMTKTSIEKVEDKDSFKHVFTMVKNAGLTDKEFNCIVMFYCKEMKLEEIATIFGRSRERVRQVIMKGLTKVRRALNSRFDIPYTVLAPPKSDDFRKLCDGRSKCTFKWNPKTRRNEVVEEFSWYNSEIDLAAYDNAMRAYREKKYQIIKNMICGDYIGSGVTVKKPLETMKVSKRVIASFALPNENKVDIKPNYTLPSGLKVVKI